LTVADTSHYLKVLAKEEIKKMESQIKSLTDRAAELEAKLDESGESNRIITQALRLKQEELNQLMIRHEALERVAKEYEHDAIQVCSGGRIAMISCPWLKGNYIHVWLAVLQVTNEKVDLDHLERANADNTYSDPDKSRFMLENRQTLNMLLLKGKRVNFR